MNLKDRVATLSGMEAASPEVALEYQVTQNDFVGAYIAHCRNSGPAKTFLYYLLPILGCASILIAVVMMVVQIRMGEDWTASIVFFMVGLFWLACHFLRPWRLRRAYRKDPRFKSPIKITINGNEWNVSTATAEARYKHGTFIRAVETDSLFLFYHSPLMFNFLPKHDLTPGQQTQIVAFLDRELPIRKGRRWLPAGSH